MESEDRNIIQHALEFVEGEVGSGIEQSRLHCLSLDEWVVFCDSNSFDLNSGGLYTSRDLTAHVNQDSDFFIPNLFHELFGHGLFCEHSNIGRDFVSLVREGGNVREYLYNTINFREQPLGICSTNIQNYEGFAVWMEDLLCRETGKEELLRRRKEELPYPKSYNALLNHFRNAEERFTRFGLIAQMGFPKHYTSQDVLKLLEKVYQSRFPQVRFSVLYGSKKPESDIDLFVVTEDYAECYFNGWLDIFEMDKEEFEEKVKMLDISVTDPLFSGELIFGDEEYYRNMKKKAQEQLITDEHVAYSMRRADENKTAAERTKNTDRQRESALSYADSYKQNAMSMEKGKKLLTLSELRKYTERH